jgi:hypothetical protein
MRLALCAATLVACGGRDGFEGVPVEVTPAFAPVPGFQPPVGDPTKISSTFGPRWKFSDQRNDFHLGVDFYGATGEPVLAIGPGTVSGTYPEGSTQFPLGGNVVVVTHALPPGRVFHGLPVTRFHAVYMHLDSIDSAEGDEVVAGQVVGTMGRSGDTTFVHLHFETRVETPCSLSFQLANPDASCVIGFDPHVHPFLFVGGANQDEIGLREIVSPTGTVFRYTATRGDLDLDVVVVGGGGTLGFGEREGIDASSVMSLDAFDYGFVRLAPLDFRSASELLEIDFHFRERPAFLELRDIYGRGLRFDVR